MALVKERLTTRKILEWADDHKKRTGHWPTSRSGKVHAANGETWQGINTALVKGGRGMPGDDSLAKLLKRKRDAADPRRKLPGLDETKILQWIDDHYKQTGEWPFREAGIVLSEPTVTWSTVDRYLKQGNGTIKGGRTLAQLLRDRRSVWDGGKPKLTEELVVQWAREHKKETGRWPTTTSGTVTGQPFEDWAAIDMALRNKRRGVTRATSLSKLLGKHFGEAYNPHQRSLSIKQICQWARKHHRKTGTWPTNKSGPVVGEQNISWGTVDHRLRAGGRGLNGGSSLAQVLDKHCR